MSSRTKLLEAARESFYRNGYMGTSVDAILQQTGVSKSNFYYHFRSKEELGLAVLDTRWREFEQDLQTTLLDDARPPEARLVAFLDRLVQAQAMLLDKGGCPFGNLVAEMADHSERFRCNLSGLFTSLTSQIARLVGEGQTVGEFRADVDAQAVAHLIVQATQGMHLMAKCHKSVDRPAQGMYLLVELLHPGAASRTAAARCA